MIVLVGGDGRGVGKTALVCAVIQLFSEMRWTAVKVSPHVDHSSPQASVGENDGQSLQSETDTARMLSAGAERAVLMCVSAGQMRGCADDLRGLARAGNLIVESTSVRAYLEPDLFLCVVDGEVEKDSVKKHLRQADAVLVRGGAGVFGMEIEGGVAVLSEEAKNFLVLRARRIASRGAPVGRDVGLE